MTSRPQPRARNGQFVSRPVSPPDPAKPPVRLTAAAIREVRRLPREALDWDTTNQVPAAWTPAYQAYMQVKERKRAELLDLELQKERADRAAAADAHWERVKELTRAPGRADSRTPHTASAAPSAPSVDADTRSAMRRLVERIGTGNVGTVTGRALRDVWIGRPVSARAADRIAELVQPYIGDPDHDEAAAAWIEEALRLTR